MSYEIIDELTYTFGDAARPDRDPAVPGRISRHRLQAVELHPDAAVHDELVPEMDGEGRTDDRAVSSIGVAQGGAMFNGPSPDDNLTNCSETLQTAVGRLVDTISRHALAVK